MINILQYVTFGGNMKLLSHYIEQQNKLQTKIVNWENHIIGDALSYSYRDTSYNRQTYPSNLHYHDYYELVIFEEGDIEYICEGYVYSPKRGDIILIEPGKFHMSAINCENTRYKRHVFYLYPSAFDKIGYNPLSSFLNKAKKGELFTFDSLELRHSLMKQLENLKSALDMTESVFKEALGLSYTIQIFYLLNQESFQVKNEILSLPQNILMLQQYIDKNFSQITSVSQVAEHFFYSREYISRLFKKYFDTTISDYIMKRRIAKSQELIACGNSIMDASYQVGFNSLSTFIRAFKTVTNMTPSEYRKMRRETFNKK